MIDKHDDTRPCWIDTIDPADAPPRLESTFFGGRNLAGLAFRRQLDGFIQAAKKNLLRSNRIEKISYPGWSTRDYYRKSALAGTGRPH